MGVFILVIGIIYVSVRIYLEARDDAIYREMRRRDGATTYYSKTGRRDIKTNKRV